MDCHIGAIVGSYNNPKILPGFCAEQLDFTRQSRKRRVPGTFDLLVGFAAPTRFHRLNFFIMGLFEKKKPADDVEAVQPEKYTNEADSGDFVPDEGAVQAETFVVGDGWVAKAQRLAGKFGVEQRGIERVPSDERTNDGMSQIGTLVRSFDFSTEQSELIKMIVAQREHGCLILCNWSPRIPHLLPWIYRYHLDHLLRQSYWNNSCLLLLHLWPSLWSETDGIESILFRMVRCKDQ